MPWPAPEKSNCQPPPWPTPNGTADQQLELFKMCLAETAEQRARLGSPGPRADPIDDRFFAAYYEVLRGRIEQSRQSAETVQRAAAAISGLYGVALGVAFSVTNNPLPARGVIPLLFLGLAIVSSTVYLSWQGGARGLMATTSPELQTGSFARQRAFIVDFQVLVADFMRRRLGWLRAAIVSLAFGLVLMPVPFVQIDTGDAPQTDVSMSITQLIDTIDPPWPDASVSGNGVQTALMESQLAEIARLRQLQLDRELESQRPAAVRLSWLPELGWLMLTLVLLGMLGAVALRSGK